MAIRFDTDADEFVIDPDRCPECGSPLYDTGCDAPGCNSLWCPDCGTGCDIEADPDSGRCANASAAESDDDYEDRVNAERAAFGLAPIGGLEATEEGK